MKRHTIQGLLTGLLILLVGGLGASSAAAQTTVVEVKNSSNATVAQFNEDGAMVALGTFGTGTLPTSGAGVRLMWDPAKAAFRAGRDFDGTHWDDANVGAYSVAMGNSTTASGQASTAMGQSTTASGSYSLAMGQSTTASGSYSLAMGQSTTASVGNSVAMGSQTTASNFYATAMGKSTTASGQASTAMGDNTEASGNRSTAMGGFTTASGLTSTAIGLSTTASGVNSTAMGDGTTASGENSTALGSNTTASGINTTAMGGTTTALGWYSTTMGVQTIAQANASLVLGRNNVITGTINSWVSTDPVLVVGNGSSTANRANAFTLLKNGNLTIAGTLTQNSDRRLKTDIHPLSDALSAIMRLQPVRYRFRAGTNRPQGVQIGLIAQEVQAVFPELVREEADGYLSLSYANLSAVLVQALKEQQAQIDTLQERLERLEIMLLQASTGSETVSSDQ